MGAGIDTTSPPLLAEAIARLTSLTRELLEEQRETNRLLNRELNPSPWLSQEEAAELLGHTVTKSRQHTRALKRYRDQGWLRTFPSMNPWRYSREEVEALARDFHSGAKYPLY